MNVPPSIVVDDADPLTPSQWQDLLTSIATATAETYVHITVFSKTADAPPEKEYSFPAAYFSFTPKFIATIPVEQPPVVTPPPPPAPTYELLYVTSTTGLKVRKTPSVTGEQIGSLAYRAQVMVTGSTPADGYTWGQLQSGGYVAREFLSKIQPPL